MDGRLRELLGVLESGPFDGSTLDRARELVDLLQSAGLGVELESQRSRLTSSLDAFAEKSGAPVVASGAHLLAADLCEMGGALSQCVERLELAMDMDPENRAAPLLLRRVLGAHKDRPRLRSLLAARANALRHWPGADAESVSIAFTEIAALYAEEGLSDEAISAYEVARAHHEHMDQLKALVELYEQRGRPRDKKQAADLLCIIAADLSEPEAHALVERALSLDPDHGQARQLAMRRSLASSSRQRPKRAKLSAEAQRRLAAAEARRRGEPAPEPRRRRISVPPPAMPQESVRAMQLAPTEPQLTSSGAAAHVPVADYQAPATVELSQFDLEDVRSLDEHPHSTPPPPPPSSAPPQAVASRAHANSTRADAPIRFSPLPAATPMQWQGAAKTARTPGLTRKVLVLGVGMLIAAVGTALAAWWLPQAETVQEATEGAKQASQTQKPAAMPAVAANPGESPQNIAELAAKSPAAGDVTKPPASSNLQKPTEPTVALLRERLRNRGATIDEDAMADALEGALVNAKSCYERALRDLPDLEGGLLLRVVVTRHGVADSVSRLDGSLDNEALLSCVTRGFSGTSYPSHPGRANARLRVPLKFSLSELSN